jgi:hypothetical protein
MTSCVVKSLHRENFGFVASGLRQTSCGSREIGLPSSPPCRRQADRRRGEEIADATPCLAGGLAIRRRKSARESGHFAGGVSM